ncbi:cytochrome C [Candidatus Marinamargulisbacteria bacterium SCGC AG-439-L15]|nr:cytochrome C [Candidatus Marinamargulisbacteria bacterium SCGC AG-439-L15]
MANKNIFPKWANKLPLLILGILGGALVTTVFIIWYWFSPKHLNIGYQPDQPIPYSHKLHAGELGIDCRYCHNFVEDGSHANIPSTETCMNCHTQIKTDSPHIKKLKESYDSNTPIKWVKVHMLPDYAYFNHSRHVNSGIGCVSCHGRVDQMEIVHQTQSLSMEWCLDCHRAPEKHLRPKNKITQMDWKAKNQLALGKKLKKLYHVNPKEDCSTCHR